MRDITVIIPALPEHWQKNYDLFEKAVDSVGKAAKLYKGGSVRIMFVRPKDDSIDGPKINTDLKVDYVYNYGETDFCSQVNCGVKSLGTEYFSILEFDDYYMEKWFKMFDDYYVTNEDVSVFLPINVVQNMDTLDHEFVNDIVWASSFSDEIGFIDFNCLENCSLFNLTGGIFKTSDWLEFKPSIKVSFNYEYLLRATNKKQKVFVVPKEGYHHCIFRPGSLSQEYVDTITENETVEWFKLAKRECVFDEDRNKTITVNNKIEELK